MDDYITVLLNDLEDRAAGFLPGEYYAAISREAAAAEALETTLTAGAAIAVRRLRRVPQ